MVLLCVLLAERTSCSGGAVSAATVARRHLTCAIQVTPANSSARMAATKSIHGTGILSNGSTDLTSAVTWDPRCPQPTISGAGWRFQRPRALQPFWRLRAVLLVQRVGPWWRQPQFRLRSAQPMLRSARHQPASRPLVRSATEAVRISQDRWRGLRRSPPW